MKKKYLSPSVKVFCVEGPTLLSGSGGDGGDGGNVDITVDGSGTEITDGGTTDPETDYQPW